MSTNRIKLVVSYDGTDFRGWATQTGRRTVQSTLKETIRRVSGEDCEIVGASRTDSGAHAKGQVCHFDCSKPIPGANWEKALNHVLPNDLRVVSAGRVSEAFHSRFCAEDRHYRYRMLNGHIDAIRGRFAFEAPQKLNLKQMQLAANALVGRHDFRLYTEELDPTVENTVRALRSVTVRQVGPEIWLDIVGTAFLRGMMRRMAGALFEVGKGKRPVHEIAELLDPRSTLHRPVVLPARGLTLMKVRYANPPIDNRTRDSDDE